MSSSVTTHPGDSREPRPWDPIAAAAVSALLFLVWGRVSPEAGWLAAIFSAAPIAIQRLRGTGAAFGTVLAAAAFIVAFADLGYAVVFLVMFAAPGVLIGEGLVRGRGLRRGCLWAFLLLCAEVLFMLLVNAPAMGEVMTKAAAMNRSPLILAQMQGLMQPEQIEQWTEQSKTLENALAVVYPAAWIIIGGLVIAANAAAVRAYLIRRDPAWLDGGEFEGVRLPFALAVAFVLAGATVVLPPLRPLGYNVLLIVAFLLWLQGLAVVLYYANRLAGPPFLRRMVVVLVLVNPWAPQLLGLLGLFDLWFDFRRYADIPADGSN
jgi:uncharacterized protein YybS (DUF2232 family)